MGLRPARGGEREAAGYVCLQRRAGKSFIELGGQTAARLAHEIIASLFIHQFFEVSDMLYADHYIKALHYELSAQQP